jgi:hypothetical protein
MRQRTVLALAKLADACFAYTNSPGSPNRTHLERGDWLAELLFENELPTALVLQARALDNSPGRVRLFVQDAWLAYGTSWVMHGDASEVGRNRAFEAVAQALLEYAHRPVQQTLVRISPHERKRAVAALQLDGLAWQGSQLRRVDESAFDVVEGATVIEALYTRTALPDPARITRELREIDDHYESGKWGDSIKHARDLLELILSTIVRSLYPSAKASRPVEVRGALTDGQFWDVKECGYVNALYQLLSEKGGHPNLAEQDNALICRQYALSVVHFVLLRYVSLATAPAESA